MTKKADVGREAPKGKMQRAEGKSGPDKPDACGAFFGKSSGWRGAQRRHFCILPFAFCISATPLLADSPGDYPFSPTVRVGQCYARITPAISVPIETPMPAPAKLKLTTRSAFFKKGEVWGVIDEARIVLEKRRLELARAQLVRKEKNDADAGLAKAELERRLQEIDTNLAAIDNQDDSALADIEGGEKFRDQLRKRTAEAKASLLKQKGLLAEKLSGLDGARDEELENLRLTLRTKEMEFTRLDEAAHLVMPCDGVVSLLIEPNPNGEYTLRTGKPFASIEDRSRYLVAVPVGAQPWRVLPPAGLTARVRVGDGAITAHWYASETTKAYGRDELVYVFEVDKDCAPLAGSLAGGSALAEIFHAPERPVRLVPKLLFSSAHPDAFSDGSEWAPAVRRVWPGHRLAVEGVAELGVLTDETPGDLPMKQSPASTPRGGGFVGFRKKNPAP